MLLYIVNILLDKITDLCLFLSSSSDKNSQPNNVVKITKSPISDS